MGNTLVPVDIVQLGDSFGTIYTVPPGKKTTVTMLHVVNTASSLQTVTVCVVPSGDSAGQDNAVLYEFPIEAYGVRELLKGDIWADGTTLQAKAGSASSVNLKLSCIESD